MNFSVTFKSFEVDKIVLAHFLKTSGLCQRDNVDFNVISMLLDVAKILLTCKWFFEIQPVHQRPKNNVYLKTNPKSIFRELKFSKKALKRIYKNLWFYLGTTCRNIRSHFEPSQNFFDMLYCKIHTKTEWRNNEIMNV